MYQNTTAQNTSDDKELYLYVYMTFPFSAEIGWRTFL